MLIWRASAVSLNDIVPLTGSHLQDLTSRGDNHKRAWGSKLALPQLSRLQFDHTFGDAFSALIASTSNGDLERSIKKWKRDKTHGKAPYFEIEVQINNPTPHYEAHIGFRTPACDQSVIYLRRKDKTFVSYAPRNWSDILEHGDDLRASATISQSTLKAIGILLRSPDDVTHG
jgi:hypothetical protein